jgi:hypothetical protein
MSELLCGPPRRLCPDRPDMGEIATNGYFTFTGRAAAQTYTEQWY